jgi:hypothetical protein
LLLSTSLTVPVSQWPPIVTNSFDGNGNLTLFTNVVIPGGQQEFYVLRTQ